MPDNPNTNYENAPLDTEDWEIAFAPYAQYPSAALTLAANLMILKAFLAIKPPMMQEAIEGLDRAMEVLFPFTEFHEVSYVLFRRLAEGKLTLEDEQILKSLGIKF
jgi:hypothetical protein